MILRNIKFSWESIVEEKFKSLLTIVSIAISIATLIVILSLSQAFYNYIVAQFQKTGTDLMWIQTESSGLSAQKSFQMDYVEKLKNLAFVKNASPNFVKSESVYVDATVGNVSVNGVNQEYASIKNMDIEGQFLSLADCNHNNCICVISDDVRKKYVYKNINPIGQQINISGINYTIIGYVAPSDNDRDYEISIEQDNAVYIPYTTFQNNYGSESLNLIVFTVNNVKNVDQYKERIDALMSDYRAHGGSYDMISVENVMSEYLSMADKINIFFVIFIVITMTISGIGIMNVLMMSTMEKKWEIGLRKSFGASRIDILRQIIAGILIQSFFGMLLGILVGIFAVTLLGAFIDSSLMVISKKGILLSVIFCFIIAFVFGSVPAIKASKMLPLDCLERD